MARPRPTAPIRPALAAVALLVAPAAARAQQGGVDSRCATKEPVLRDACQKGLDIFNLLAPQLGASLAGGNAVLGQSGALGGLGHLSIGVRGNVLRGTIPQTAGVTLSGTAAQATNFSAKDQILGLPTAEVAIGLFKGLSMGLTNVGGVDAIVSASYVPDLDIDEVSVTTTGGSVKLGYGVRVGILQETSLVPGVSLTFLRRDLPRTDVLARVGGDTISVSNIDARSSAWRLVAGKRLAVIGFTGGVGRDTYDASASAGAVVHFTVPGVGVVQRSAPTEIVAARQELTRTNFFGDVTLFLPFARLTGEVGRVSGGDVPAPYNSFGGATGGESYTYFSAGLRVQF